MIRFDARCDTHGDTYSQVVHPGKGGKTRRDRGHATLCLRPWSQDRALAPLDLTAVTCLPAEHPCRRKGSSVAPAAARVHGALA
jgi:hypothetical protein